MDRMDVVEDLEMAQINESAARKDESYGLSEMESIQLRGVPQGKGSGY